MIFSRKKRKTNEKRENLQKIHKNICVYENLVVPLRSCNMHPSRAPVREIFGKKSGRLRDHHGTMS